MYLHSESLATIFNNVTTDDVLRKGEVGLRGGGVVGTPLPRRRVGQSGSAIRIVVIEKLGRRAAGKQGGKGFMGRQWRVQGQLHYNNVLVYFGWGKS